MSTTEENREATEAQNSGEEGNQEEKGVKGQAYEFSDLSEASSSRSPGNIDFILDIPLEINVELGRTKMVINELLRLGQGSVIELSKFAGEALEIKANQKLIARGDVVVVNEKYGIRITEIVSPTERIERLR